MRAGRYIFNSLYSTGKMDKQMVGGLDCQFAAVTEEYLPGKWETLVEVCQQVLSVLGSH
jgi:hypothetical protein